MTSGTRTIDPSKIGTFDRTAPLRIRGDPIPISLASSA